MALPEELPENDLDDIQSVDFDLNSLVQRFISPIEAKRSFKSNLPTVRNVQKGDRFAAVTLEELVQKDLDTASADTFPQESRAHTFYRMLGLPVVDADFNFFNPGFNPDLSVNDIGARQLNIAQNSNTDIDKLQADRERVIRENDAIFRNRKVVEATIFALAMQRPKPFLIMDKNVRFGEFDSQEIEIRERETFLRARFIQPDGSDLPRFFTKVKHILRPFVTNSVLVNSVQDRTKEICQPFLLTRESTQLEEDVFLDRPGLEFILRLRLQQQSPEESLFQEQIAILEPDLETQGITRSDLLQIAVALLEDKKIKISGKSEIEQTIIEGTSGITDLELININKLVKLIKRSVFELVKSIETLERIHRKIDWAPLPGKFGPRFSDDTQVARFIVPKRASSALERRIRQLRLKQANVTRRGIISPNDDIASANFAVSYFENTENLFEKELNAANSEKNDLVRAGAEALQKVEIITGEVSGLGLVDILAIYTALWAIDLDTLVSLIDNDAFTRLKLDFELIHPSVQNRIDNGGSPVIPLEEAMNIFESKIINILSWADRIVNQNLSTPNTQEGGQLP